MQKVGGSVFSVLKRIRENKTSAPFPTNLRHRHKNAPAETGVFFIVLIREKILDLTVMIVFAADAS